MSDTTTVAVGDYSITSNSESAEEMIASLSPKDPASDQPVEVGADGQPKEGPTPLSKAASELGKKGGQASAKKRAAAEQAEDEPVSDGVPDEPAPEKADKAADDATEEPDSDSDKAADDTSEDGKKLGKPRHDPRARVQEVTRKLSEVNRQLAQERAERDRLAYEINRLRSERPVETSNGRAPVAADGDQDPEPKIENFEEYEKFSKELARWTARQEFRRLSGEESKRRQLQEYASHVTRAMSEFTQRINTASESDPEFIERVSPVVRELRPSFSLSHGEWPGPENVIADEIISSERAPALMLYLTEHPQELQRLSALRTPQQVQVEMRVIAKTLAAATAGASVKAELSKAKPPVRPVTGSPHTADVPPGDDASYDEHYRYYSSKERRR